MSPSESMATPVRPTSPRRADGRSRNRAEWADRTRPRAPSGPSRAGNGARVRLLGRAEAGVLANRPGSATVHGCVRAAREGIDARRLGLEPGHVLARIDGLDLDPRLGLARFVCRRHGQNRTRPATARAGSSLRARRGCFRSSLRTTAYGSARRRLQPITCGSHPSREGRVAVRQENRDDIERPITASGKGPRASSRLASRRSATPRSEYVPEIEPNANTTPSIWKEPSVASSEARSAFIALGALLLKVQGGDPDRLKLKLFTTATTMIVSIGAYTMLWGLALRRRLRSLAVRARVRSRARGSAARPTCERPGVRPLSGRRHHHARDAPQTPGKRLAWRSRARS